MILTVIDLSEYGLLFDGDNLVDHGREIGLLDVARRANGRPVKLRTVSAANSDLDLDTSSGCDVFSGMNLSYALTRCRRSPKVGFA